MKPIMLKIKGLNSFQEEQVIDFSKLTEKGLFGIFGTTGSGKSTILDAITLALYGEISRANKNDKGYINTNTDTAIVSLEFEIGSGLYRKTYLAERNIKRDKHGAYKTKQVRLIQKTEDKTEVLADKGREVNNLIEDIIGLKLDDFTRSVVLPQGKFSEFLKLTGSDKRNMLERIFNLERYGKELSDKVKSKRNNYIKKETSIQGQLSAYEGIDNERVKKLEIDIKELKDKEITLVKQRDKLGKEFEKYKEIYKYQQELKIYLEEKEFLEKDKDYYEENKIKVEKGTRANDLKKYILNLNETKENIAKNNKKMEEIKIDLLSLEPQLYKEKELFEKAEDEKNIKIPELTRKESMLEQAIKIQNQVSKHIAESEKHILELKNRTKLYEKKKEDKRILNEEINNINDVIGSNEKEIVKNKVEPDYRALVQSTFDLEKEYKNLKKDILTLEDEIKEKEDFVKEKKSQLLKNNAIRKEKESEIKSARDSLDKLESPGNTDVLSLKQKEVIDFKNELIILKDNIDKKKELITNKEDIKNKIKTINENKIILNKKIIKDKNMYDFLKEEIEKIIDNNKASNFAKDLKEGEPCPVCGSVHHINIAVEIENTLLNEKNDQLKDLENKITENEKLENSINIQLARLSSSKESIDNQLIKYAQVDENTNIKILKLDLDTKEKEMTSLKEKIKEYEIISNELKNKILKLTDELGKLNSISSSIDAMIVTETNNLNEKSKKKSEKLSLFNVKKEGYFSLKEEINIDNIEEEIININIKEKKVRTLEEINSKKNKDKEEKNKILEELLKNINDILMEIREDKTNIDSIKSQINEKEKEYKSLYSGKDPINELKSNNKQIQDINENYKESKVKYEEINQKLIEAYKLKESLLSEERTLKNIKLGQDEQLTKLLSENNFTNTVEALDCIIKPNVLKNMIDDISIFENKMTLNKGNIEKLSIKLNGESIEDEKYKEIQQNIDKLSNLYNENHDKLVATNQLYEDVKNKLEICIDLNNKLKKIKDKLELIRQIENLIKGNRFVEYVAKYQLKYIAKEASKRLRDISRDRFGLEIDDESNFVIVDDYNGGERRSANTLSGGETFLASLSLALALSSQIQLKGSAPLEFFFLDEGFGTLDHELLDIVISSLERLHSDNLSIGIISHVEEIKHRIPVKLIVTGAKPGEGGTKVKIDY